MQLNTYRSNARWLALFSRRRWWQRAGANLIRKIPVPGDYGWDYLTADGDGRRLYVSHDKEVVVIDLDSGAIIRKIPGSDVHGIAVVRDFGRRFISATDPSSVSIFNLKTLAVIDKGRSAKTRTQFFTTARQNEFHDRSG